jgi:hypothetical protein
MNGKTGALAIVVAMLVFAALQAKGGLFGTAKEDVHSAAFLNKVAGEINKQLPKAIDQDTQLANVSAMDGVLVYNYRLVNRLAADFDATALVSGIKPQATRGACTTPDTRDKFLNQGITLRFSYADKNGSPIASFDVTPGDCKV